MKKITTILLSIALAVFAVPAFAAAATTATFAPATANVNEGQTFNVSISVNSAGTANYAEKVEVNFPADILEVTSFSFASNWIAMAQPGYDTTDNTNGILVKTAGYPSGITSATPFGTVSFRAKKAGTGTIKIGNNSISFQASAQGTITGNTSSVTVTAPAKAQVAAVSEAVAKPEVKVSSTVSNDGDAGESMSADDASAHEGQLAAAAATTDTTPAPKSSHALSWVIGLIILIGIAGYITRTMKKKNRGGPSGGMGMGGMQ